jgi:hypothetical protein
MVYQHAFHACVIKSVRFGKQQGRFPDSLPVRVLTRWTIMTIPPAIQRRSTCKAALYNRIGAYQVRL